MIIDYHDNIAVIKQENTIITELIKNIQTQYSKFIDKHVIIQLNTLKDLKENDIMEFLVVSNKHRANRLSFVIVSDNLSLEEMPDELLVVPTLKEAHDIIEMEEMERNLGF